VLAVAAVETSVWFDDVGISEFHSCVVVDLLLSLSEWIRAELPGNGGFITSKSKRFFFFHSVQIGIGANLASHSLSSRG
jgi:hypothetical protein